MVMKVDFPRGNEIIFEPVAHLVYSVASVGLLKRVWTSFSDSNFWNFFRFHASSSLIIQYLATDDSKDSTVVIPLMVGKRIYFLRERGEYKSMVLEFPNPIWHIQQENLGFGNVSEFHFQTFNLEISFSLSFIFFIDHPVLDYREPML